VAARAAELVCAHYPAGGPGGAADALDDRGAGVGGVHRLGARSGLKAAQQIRASFPEMGILVLSAHVETQYLGKLIADSSGYIGYVLKDRVANLDEFSCLMNDIVEGKSVIDQTVVKDLPNRTNNRAALARLTDRERKVLELMATSRSNKAIASRLSPSRRSVKSTVNDVSNKLDLPDREDDQRRVLAVIAYLQA
jgi:DNA-binding NarL/FixJ family response regulator